MEKIYRYSHVSGFIKRGAKSLIEEDNTIKDNENASIRFGNLTETLLFFPDKFKDKYFIEPNKPTESIRSPIDYMFENGLEFNEENVTHAIFEMGFKLNWYRNAEKRREGIAYFENLTSNNGKIPIGKNELDMSNLCNNSLLTNPITSKYIFKKDDDFLENIEVCDQLTVYSNLKFKEDSYYFRSTFDRLIINRKDKTIQIIDLKTGFKHPLEFEDILNTNHYYLQAEIYLKQAENLVLGSCKDEYGDNIDLDIENYRILPFIFVYVSPNYHKMPIAAEYKSTYNDSLENIVELEIAQVLKKMEWHHNHEVYDIDYDYAMLEDKIIVKYKKESDNK